MIISELQEFDDELKIMQELMQEAPIVLADTDLNMPIGSLNRKRALTVELGTPANHCIDLMVARQIGCLVVLSDGKLTGIFTERDILMKIAGQDLDLTKVLIDDVMTSHPVALQVTDSIETAIRLMHSGRYRHVAIVDPGRHSISVISIKDIVAYIVEFFPQSVLNLPPHPIRLGTKNREGG